MRIKASRGTISPMTEKLKKIFVQVAVSLPVNGTFTYMLSADLTNGPPVGKRVIVPFSRRNVTGYILRVIPPENRKGLRDVTSIIDLDPLFPSDMVPFFEWLSDYYHYPVGLVIKTALPSGLNVKTPKDKHLAPGECLDKVGVLKRVFIAPAEGVMHLPENLGAGQPRNERAFLEMIFQKGELSLAEAGKAFQNGPYLVDKWVKKGLLKKTRKPVVREISGETLPIATVPPLLNPFQRKAVEELATKIKETTFFVYLLHGVTGSGKTEVYYHAVKAALELGRRCIIMVPEIALTLAMASFFKARLGDGVAILHSALSPGERYDQWLRIAQGRADIVIGARSALFAPVSRLGLIIVDEEHDASYKQEEQFRYQARDSATVRAKLTSAVVILGSGTPSVQSYRNATSGRYGLLAMPKRVQRRELPDVTIVDMKNLEGSEEGSGIVSPPLKQALEENLSSGKQAILFLNRRGFSAFYLCRFCGEALKCPNCEVSLTYHKDSNNLLCHYCGFKIKPPSSCPSCNRAPLIPYGFGTEKVVEILGRWFPDARAERMDRDTMRHKGEVQRVLRRFLDRQTDILVGTQMVTKGHDFPHVTLVGVLSADLSLNTPDFRAGETTFQLLSQVAGRTGRGSSPGKVIIQTFNPAHYAILAAKEHNYQRFFSREIRLRRSLNYPPFCSAANVRLVGNSQEKTETIARDMGAKIGGILGQHKGIKKDFTVLGPVESPIPKLKGKYRQQILIKSRSSQHLGHLLKELERAAQPIISSAGVRMIIDVDPYHMA
jgi:primosomal protein N' (replication factor Y)